MLINPPQEMAIYTILKTAIEELIKVNITYTYVEYILYIMLKLL